MEKVFLNGDNSPVVATDTCKNTVYILAKRYDFDSIEDFGMIICRHFLNEYPKFVNKLSVKIIKDNWQRISTCDSSGKISPHKHSFKRFGPEQFYTVVVGKRSPSQSISLAVTSGIRNLDILKTTQSGFEGFHRDKYTSLPESNDRLLGTSATVEWEFTPKSLSLSKINFNQISGSVVKSLLDTFSGPSDVGVYSASVQQTLYDMGKAVLEKESRLEKVILEMPNIHNIPFPLENYGLSNKDHTGLPSIFFPIDEPHGMIKAVVQRSPSPPRSKL